MLPKSNDMKAIAIVFSVIILSNYSFAKTQRDTSLLNIDFQDFFTHDTMSLSINGTVILKNAVMTSDRITGFTDVYVTIVQKTRKIFSVQLPHESTDVNAEKLITLEVSLNGRTTHYSVDYKKGKYVGFSKVNNQISFIQQSKRFFYD
jgi:hypothetical protein